MKSKSRWHNYNRCCQRNFEQTLAPNERSVRREARAGVRNLGTSWGGTPERMVPQAITNIFARLRPARLVRCGGEVFRGQTHGDESLGG